MARVLQAALCAWECDSVSPGTGLPLCGFESWGFPQASVGSQVEARRETAVPRASPPCLCLELTPKPRLPFRNQGSVSARSSGLWQRWWCRSQTAVSTEGLRWLLSELEHRMLSGRAARRHPTREGAIGGLRRMQNSALCPGLVQEPWEGFTLLT